MKGLKEEGTKDLKLNKGEKIGKLSMGKVKKFILRWMNQVKALKNQRKLLYQLFSKSQNQ